MLVSHRKEFVFTKTVKTAGTSVEVYFEQYCLPEMYEWRPSHFREQYVGDSGIIGYRGFDPGDSEFVNHLSAAELKSKLGPEIWERYFKFTVVRNPFDRLISAFYHFELHRNKPKYERSQATEIESFRRWLKSGRLSNDRRAYTIDGQMCVDFVIRYEQLNQDIERVCSRLDIPFVESQIPNLKANFRNREMAVAEFYDSEAIDLVSREFEFEISEFGYEYPGLRVA